MRCFYIKYFPIIITLLITNILSLNIHAQNNGFSISSKSNDYIDIQHLIPDFKTKDSSIILEGIYLQAEEGTPNLPNNSCFIIIPNNARPQIELISYKEKVIENINIEPARRLNIDSKDNDSIIFRNPDIYLNDAYFPEEIYKTSNNQEVRGFNSILLNVSPFQYNPIRKTLKVIYDINLRISFQNNDNQYGNERLRSYEWDEILKNIVLNPEMINDFDYDRYFDNVKDKDKSCEYLIITPDNEDIRQWADSIARYRNEQGIMTKVINIKDIKENKPLIIRDYLKNIYDNWDLVPSSVLIFGDYNNDMSKGVTSFYLNDHPEVNLKYLTDNKLVDFNNDNLPEMNIARLTVADAEDAELMFRKLVSYENNPSVNPHYYNRPVTAMGFQESRWFQLCSEIIAGYFSKNGREPIHLNAVYEGNPDSVWSTAPNTSSLIEYFGPDGLSYIPSNIRHLQEWNAGQEDLLKAINEGTFLVQHRDHGNHQNWGEPYFSNNDIDRLNNEDLTFVMSANCKTGNFNFGNGLAHDCFAERFLRSKNGAIAVVAASEVSYSFVNDTYVWGYYDYLWNDFIPSFRDKDNTFKYPSFANVYAKYFLKQSSWPYINDYKDITYNLFHYFGDAYLQLNTAMHKEIEISYPDSITSACNSFIINKDGDTRVAFSVDGKIIARSYDDDSIISFTPQISGKKIKVVATRQDHYRHEGYIDVVSYLSDEELKVYPNPTDGKIFIEGKDIRNIVIYNSLGQILYQYDNIGSILSEKIEINCEHIKEKLLHLSITYLDGRVKIRPIINN